jgi:hypothetical protein
MQNANYFETIKYKISKFSGLCLVPSKRLFWIFEAKIQNGE